MKLAFLAVVLALITAAIFAVWPVFGAPWLPSKMIESEEPKVQFPPELSQFVDVAVLDTLYHAMFVTYGPPPWPCEDIKGTTRVWIAGGGYLFRSGAKTITVQCDRFAPATHDWDWKVKEADQRRNP